ncbi:hypothetical protein FKM82_017047 [Ascaphus truei]
MLKIRDFARKAKEVCEHMDRFSSLSPFLCMDLAYITALLREGFGFEDSTTLQVTWYPDTSKGAIRTHSQSCLLAPNLGLTQRVPNQKLHGALTAFYCPPE